MGYILTSVEPTAAVVSVVSHLNLRAAGFHCCLFREQVLVGEFLVEILCVASHFAVVRGKRVTNGSVLNYS